MMTMDSELAGLDLAVGKALGFDVAMCGGDCERVVNKEWFPFSPTRDIAEAMRLAAEHRLIVDFNDDYAKVVEPNLGHQFFEYFTQHSGDKLRACCVAICRAIVEGGKE